MLNQTMPYDEIETQHAVVAGELGIDPTAINGHSYDVEVVGNGYQLVRWHDQALDGVIREGILGSYTTRIRLPDDLSRHNFVERLVSLF